MDGGRIRRAGDPHNIHLTVIQCSNCVLVFCEGVSPKKSLVKIGEPSHTRRFASNRGEFSPVAIWIFGSSSRRRAEKNCGAAAWDAIAT
jgi:hypothetical protein